VSKILQDIAFNPTQCRTELAAYKRLLDARQDLGERKDVHRFFRRRKHLSALIGTFAPDLGPAKQMAFEFPFLGDFCADLVLGNRGTGAFCVVEFEDGRRDSIFRKARQRSATEWSPRFEHGFSQLVDWFYSLDDFKKTDRFAQDFGHGHIRFVALLILGRNAGVSEQDRNRLRWRTEKVRVDSHTVECYTFDDLYHYLNMRLSFYPEVSGLEAAD
jgi:hypothetical protein